MNSYVREAFEIVEHLNEVLYELDMENKYMFSIDTNGDSYTIDIAEIESYGEAICIYTSEETTLDAKVEKDLEAGLLTHKGAVLAQILIEFRDILMGFSSVYHQINNKLL